MALKKIYYLSKLQYETLLQNGTVTLSDGVTVINYTPNEHMYLIPSTAEEDLFRHVVEFTADDSNSQTYGIVLRIYNTSSGVINTSTKLINALEGKAEVGVSFDTVSGVSMNFMIYQSAGKLYAKWYDGVFEMDELTNISVVDDAVIPV